MRITHCIYNKYIIQNIPSGANCHSYWTIYICLVHPCDKASNGGCSQICNKRKHKFECACEDGFLLDGNGKTCKKG